MTVLVRITPLDRLHCTAATHTEDQRRNLESAFRDGQDMALCGEARPEFWDLIDSGYTPEEAKCVIYAHKATAS